MKKFKIKQLDMNNNLLRSDIVNGKNKHQVEQWAAEQVETVEGQTLPVGIMQNDTFYIVVIEM